MHAIVFPTSRTKRMREALKHPDQAAMVARIPVIGRRVPMRAMWLHRSPDAYRMTNRGLVAARPYALAAWTRAKQAGNDAADIGVRGLFSRARGVPSTIWNGRNSFAALPEAAAEAPMSLRLTNDAVEPVIRESKRSRRALWMIPIGFIAASLGVLAMYYVDPQAGRRRRALMRDKMTHYRNVLTRRVPRTAERRSRFFRGRARGLQHEVLHRGAGAVPDNETLVARVRSEVLRDHNVKAGEIHVDAYEGIVTLRGQMASMGEIRALVGATQSVDGVREVRSYLHLPGTPPPNKAEAYASNGVPEHLTRV